MSHQAEFAERLAQQGIEVRYGQPLKNYCSWKIGGTAQVLAVPKNADETAAVFKIAAECGEKPEILAQGTNVLFSDNGIRSGVLLRELKEISWQDNTVTASAGASLGHLARAAAQRGWVDLAFISGVPGSIGGAVVMNAGCYGREIGSLVSRVFAVDRQGRSFVFTREECLFGYRQSRFKDGELVVLAAELVMEQKQDPQDIAALIADYQQKRLAAQPYQWPNAGSVFKNPPANSAGRLIEQAGLKGYKIGDAQVSEKHANFIVNLGDARAEDVIALIKHIRRCVWEKYQIQLQPEVKFIGFAQDPLL